MRHSCKRAVCLALFAVGALACVGHDAASLRAQPPVLAPQPTLAEPVPTPNVVPGPRVMPPPAPTPTPEPVHGPVAGPWPYAPAPACAPDCIPKAPYNQPFAGHGWNRQPVGQPFYAQPYMPHGEYVERDRIVHTPSYRLRVDDVLEFVYRLTRDESPGPYRIGVGDKLRIESLADPTINREILTVLPDGTVVVKILNNVPAARRTIAELRDDLEKRYTEFYRVPGITVTPIEVNAKLEDLRAAIVARFGNGGQIRTATVTPEGTIQLPVVGSVPVQGMTIDELKREIDERYAREIQGIEVMPVLLQRAPRFVYVLGEVRNPGRYELVAPTSVMQSISLAGGWNVGANLYHVVVFRRDDNWQLMATRLNVWNPAYGNTLQARDDIWLGDSDIVLVPKMKILVLDEYIDLIFTRGLYGVVPFQGVSVNMAKLSTL